MENFSSGFEITSCVFASFLTIISIRRNKREHRTTLQSRFIVPNVSSYTFFRFRTPSKGKLSWCHFGVFKKGFQGTWCSSLSRVEKFSNGFDDATYMCVSFLTTISIRRNKLEHSHDASIRFYNSKRELMHIFKIPYPLRARIALCGFQHKIQFGKN